jgi:hypothetical protein
VLPDFTKIYVESDYTDVSLYFNSESTFAFDILHHNKAVLRLPGEGVSAEEMYDGKDHYTTVGTMGTGETAGQVKIDALQKCYVNLSYK